MPAVAAAVDGLAGANQPPRPVYTAGGGGDGGGAAVWTARDVDVVRDRPWLIF